MTNKKDADGDQACDSRLAAFLAVHMVKQILDDAYVIANSAIESGQPWRYLSTEKTVRQSETDGENVSSKVEHDVINENKMKLVANEVVTSTPQKVTGDQLKVEGSFIGQGDEDPELHQNELTQSTSMFINYLFDMSDVEKIIDSDDNCNVNSNSQPNELLKKAMGKIMDSYVNTAVGLASEQPTESLDSEVPIEKTSSAAHSEYSFLSDAFAADIDKDIAFYIPDAGDPIECEVSHVVPEVKIKEINNENPEECKAMIEAAQFEKAYLSLNRDDEQGSEDDGNVILEDPKGMTLQEVELMTANTSNEDLSTHGELTSDAKCEKSKELTATSAVSAVSKKSLVSKCRSQGARLLACLRGWWRRRTPGNRKEHQHRVSGTVRGLCPLSPDARRRAASLLDQRLLRPQSPSGGGVWKFNTVNEALVNSSRWKDYTFELNSDQCGEY
ncbi:unnamed protein product [Arctia plantaginis]|uniref:Uncharacterized protein n=1 Tax=Arctia plantaginis TaxID=874455 RepID=A0A8S0ZQS3_ARCPL|nr:unnamed protein product [Arctia plantaginis]